MSNIKINKDFLVKNLSAIICVVLILFMFLPLLSVNVEMSVMGVSNDSSSIVTGFQALSDGGIYGILLLLMPIIIIAAGFIGALKKYKKYITLIAPVVSLVMLLWLIPSQIKAGASGGDTSLDISTSYGVGFWLILVGNLVLIALAVVRFLGDSRKDVPLQASTGGVSMPKINTDMLNLDKLSDTMKSGAQAVKSGAQAVKSGAQAVSEQVKTISGGERNKSLKAQEETLELIKNLHSMKEQGILTEEEFAEKKKEMLAML